MTVARGRGRGPAEELARYLGGAASPPGAAALDARRLVPMLCERAEASERVLARPGWLFELKLDGVRILADKRGGDVHLYYRKGREATASYADVAEALATLPDERLLLDGEIVAFDEQGKPDFQRLGHRIQTEMAGPGDRSEGAGTLASGRPRVAVPVVFVVFDVLAVGPYDVRRFPLEARKELLARILPEEGVAGGIVRVHPTFTDGRELFRLCQEHRLEGVVAKRLGSSYRDGERGADWLKIKCEHDAEFVVIGWTEGDGERERLGALDLGAYEGDRLVFRGRVGSGLDAATIDALLARLRPLEVDRPVAQGKYSPKPRRHHVRPEIVVSVRYGGFSLDPSGARFLRFPVFRGVRPDVSPRDCTAAPDDDISERASQAAEARARGATGPATTPAAAEQTPRARPRGRGRLHLTAPEQAVLPDGTTKAALGAYFEAVAPALLRHARGRICALHKPGGALLWPPPRWTPKFVRTASMKVAGRDVRGFVLDSPDALLFSVEAMSPCARHGPWLEDQVDRADFVALRVAARGAQGSAPRSTLSIAARAVRTIADELGLPSAPRCAGALSVDVLVGVGAAPATFTTTLGQLLLRVVEQELVAAAIDGATVTLEDTVPAAFAPIGPVGGAPAPASASDESALVAVPLEWDELDAVDLGALTTEEGVRRAAIPTIAQGRVESATVDLAAAAAAIERVVASRASR